MAFGDVADLRLEARRDPTEMVTRAHAALERALKIDPKDPYTHTTLTDLLTVEGRWAALSGRDPQPTFAAAEANGKAAVALSSGKDLDALRALAGVYRWRADWSARSKRSVAADVRDGLAVTARALAQTPGDADVAETEGALHLATARAATNAARVEAAGRAHAALERALRINRNLEHRLRPLFDEAAQLARSR